MTMLDFCKGPVVTVDAAESLVEAALRMDSRCVGALVVLTQGNHGKPVGILTDRDIVVKGVAKNLNLENEKVATAMTVGVLTVSGESSLTEAIKLMSDHKVRRLVVVDKSLCAIGVFSVDDLIKHFASEASQLSELIFRQTGTSSRHHVHDFTQMA